jgi:enoyl-CoA hydratase/carnithine racemase
MADPGRITLERRGHLLLMGIDRPTRRNGFSLAMYEALARAYHELDIEDDLRCGVLFAHGDHFTAGIDLIEFVEPFSLGRSVVPSDGLDPMGLDGPRVRKPIVVAVSGICFTIGIELMLAADIRIASSDTRFSQMEVRRGIYAVGGATVRFARECGWGNAMKHLLTGDEFDAAEAFRIGLVQEVVAPGQQVERAIALASEIADQAPLAVAATLASARIEVLEGEEEAGRRLLPDLRPLINSEDVQEGLASFLQKRKAEFKGR